MLATAGASAFLFSQPFKTLRRALLNDEVVSLLTKRLLHSPGQGRCHAVAVEVDASRSLISLAFCVSRQKRKSCSNEA